VSLLASRFDAVQPIADAVLYEGYVLYPYRASAAKNRTRFQFGVVAPRRWAERDGSDRWTLWAECIVEYDTATRLDARVRFLHTPAKSRDAQGWDEAVAASVDVAGLDVTTAGEHETPFDAGGVTGRVAVRTELLPGPYPLTRVHVAVENLTDWDDPGAPRDEMVRHALLSAQVVLAVDDGVFISSIDPPEFARAAVDACAPGGLWPVLAGSEGERDLMLCAPIILYDHPEVAPESTTEFCDATEIDEMLALRVLTLTDDEKREARATDPRAREIIDRWADFPPELVERLHGAMRTVDDVDPDTDEAIVVGGSVRKGDKVRLQPLGRSDAQDLFLVGQSATVAGVFRDLDGETHVAVTIDGDPGADLHDWYGRYRYFNPEELALPRVLVAGIGNIFLGDDGFGVEVAARLTTVAVPAHVKVADFGIRSLHLAYELLEGYDTLILVDTVHLGDEPPGTVALIEADIEPGAGTPLDAHTMNPETVLASLRELGGSVGRVLVVGCQPATLEEGIGLSEPVAAAVDDAVTAVLELVSTKVEAQ